MPQKTTLVTILDTLNDRKLFARWFADSQSWSKWRIFLAVLFGLPIAEAELEVFTHHTGRTVAPTQPAREVWAIVGRRGGKSRIAALLAVFLAAFRDVTQYLAPGEWGTLPIIAADRKQARTVFRYVTALFEYVPMLKKLVTKKGAEFIELGSKRIVIEIHTASYKSTRGYSCIGVIADEVAFWASDEYSANPDKEIIQGLRPSLVTIPGSLLIAISSPYARRGMLWESYERHWGKDDDDVLVWQAESREMNPNIPARVVEQAMEEDESAALAEWGGQFRKDIESFVSKEVIEAVTIPGREELPFCTQGKPYRAFCDPSGGSVDSMTLCIGHKEKDKFIIDAVRETKAPFSPESTVADFSTLLKAYGCFSVTGDAYAGVWPEEKFSTYGVKYERSPMVKTDLYNAALPILNSSRCELPDNRRLRLQLLALERSTGRGKPKIDHPPRGHDDVANSVLGLLAMMSTTPVYKTSVVKVRWG